MNKHRQVLAAMFSYACRADTYGLAANPVAGTDKRREAPIAALDYYEVEEVEGLARVCEQGCHRPTSAVSDEEAEARAAEDRQDAEAFRILLYTGIRVGELVTLRWADVDLDARTLLVCRNLSAGVETEPKGAPPSLRAATRPALSVGSSRGPRRVHPARRLRRVQPLGETH